MFRIKGYEFEIDYTNQTFPDGTLNLNGMDITGCTRIEWYYDNDAELFTLICLAKKCAEHSCSPILYMPYVPNARMDRVKKESDTFTLKYFCDIINSLNFRVVMVRDVHSNVAAALLDRCVVIEPTNYIREAINQVYLLTGGNEGYSRKEVMSKFIAFYPDEGAMKRYSSLLDFPYAFGIKKRDWETGNILGLEIMNKEIVEGKNVLIIDDICSKGGTFYHAAKALKELGAHSIYLYVTHCEKTITSGNIYYGNEIEQIFTTDSIWRDKNDPRVKILEV